MRDRRFVAVHRGGPLDGDSHRFLAGWAADCAELALPYFAGFHGDSRPADALDVCRAWARGEVRAGLAMKASLAAHAAARAANDTRAIAAARAAGQAVATAHCADHSMGAALYAVKALNLDQKPWEMPLERMLARLPPHLLPPVAEGIHARLRFMKLRHISLPLAKTGATLPAAGFPSARGRKSLPAR